MLSELQPQDVLRVTDIRGDEYIVPCMSIIHTYDGGIQTEIKSPNPDTSTSIKGSLGKAVNELKMELLEVQRLFAKYARIDLLNVDRIESGVSPKCNSGICPVGMAGYTA